MPPRFADLELLRRLGDGVRWCRDGVEWCRNTFHSRTPRSANAPTHPLGHSRSILPPFLRKQSAHSPNAPNRHLGHPLAILSSFSRQTSSAQPCRPASVASAASAAASQAGTSSSPDVDPPPELWVLPSAALDPSHDHENDADVKALYDIWSATRPPPPPYDPSPLPDAAAVVALAETNAWATKAAAAWVLSQELRDRRFEAYALAQLIQHCGTALFGPWEFVEARCPPRSSIRRFTNHWVAWNTSFAAPGSEQDEFAGLEAATLGKSVVRDETHDPRTFDLDHWFSGCGDQLAAKCRHDPVVRMHGDCYGATLKKEKDPAPVVGRGDELRVRVRRGKPARSCWRFKRRIACSVSVLQLGRRRHLRIFTDPPAPFFTGPLLRRPEFIRHPGRPSDRTRHPPAAHAAPAQPLRHSWCGIVWLCGALVRLFPVAAAVYVLLLPLQPLRYCQRSALGSRHQLMPSRKSRTTTRLTLAGVARIFWDKFS